MKNAKQDQEKESLRYITVWFDAKDGDPRVDVTGHDAQGRTISVARPVKVDPVMFQSLKKLAREVLGW